ncbi:hypothetical protein HDR58_07610 [bacterium]|nr:hypothetical protein [bacterium]
MASYNFGTPLNSRIYQKNINYAHNTYGPKINVSRGPIMCRGNHSPNVTYQIAQPKFNWGGFILGALPFLFQGIGMLFGGRGGGSQAVQQTYTPQTQTAQQDPNAHKTEANLKKLFPKFNFVKVGEDSFRASSEDGSKQFGPLSFDEMCEEIGKYNSTPAQPEGQPEGDNPRVTPEEENPAVDNSNDGKGAVDNKTVKNNNNNQNTQKTDKAKNTTKTEWSAEQKAKPIRLNMSVNISSLTSSTANVVTPDGKQYSISLHTTGSSNSTIMTQLSEKLKQRLKDAGWTNVTLENQNFKWASDGSEATGKVDKPKTKEWSAAEKAKPRTLTISFAVRNFDGSGSATVTTPDGKLYQVNTGMSLTPARARKDLAEQMKQRLNDAGWTNVTLENKTFTDWQ